MDPSASIDHVRLQYAGLWYEAYRSNGVIFEFGSKCVNATYTLNDDGTVGVWNQAINFFGQYSSIRGSAAVKNSIEPAALEVTFEKPSEFLAVSSFSFSNNEQARRVITTSSKLTTRPIRSCTHVATFQ